MRANIERAGVGAVDELGQPTSTAWAALATVPAWLWSQNEAEIADTVKLAVVEQLRMLVPKGTDVTETDRINGVVDRRGNPVRAGILVIESVVRRKAHLELEVRGGVA